jgi:N4-gp56 family major capsid protein
MHNTTILPIDLQAFDPTYDGGAGAAGVELNTNVTTQESLSAENKTFWDKALIVLAAPELVHDQFAQQRDIPANNGKTIEFRQFDPLPEVTTPLTEGVTPAGQALTVNATTATVAQYGGYVTTSDVLDMTALDPVVNEATKLIARQAGETLDTITRDIINAGTNVQYSQGNASSRPTARSGVTYTSATNNPNLTVDEIKLAVRTLKRQDAPKINGDYVGIIHPDVAYDLMKDPEWLAPKQYVDTDGIYNGEIGKLYGVRFIENTRAKTFTVGSGSDAFTVYSTLIIGDDAYGTTKVANGGLQHIVKPLGSGGSSDPLNQRATVGWKAVKTAKILIPQYIVRVESTATP